MSSLNPQGLAAVIAAYGTIHFWGTQILRIAGCTLGGLITDESEFERRTVKQERGFAEFTMSHVVLSGPGVKAC